MGGQGLDWSRSATRSAEGRGCAEAEGGTPAPGQGGAFLANDAFAEGGRHKAATRTLPPDAPW